MGVPTITNVYPASGHTGGETMVRILGGNFRVPPNPLRGEAVPDEAAPTVRVTFGGEPAEYVAVVNHALMYVRTPISPLSAAKTGAGTGAVDVVVTNIDDDGNDIPGETYTAADAFEYQDLKLTTESDLARVVRAIMREMRKQLVREVVLSPHTDYDADTADGLNTVETAELPAIALIGPTITPNRLYATNTLPYTDGHGHQVQRREPYFGDVTFQLVGMTDKMSPLINLQAAVITFFQRNGTIKMLRDASDPSHGYATYDMELVMNAGVDVTAPGDDANVKSFSTRFVIRGFPIEGVAGFDGVRGGTVTITEPVADDDDAIVLETSAL